MAGSINTMSTPSAGGSRRRALVGSWRRFSRRRVPVERESVRKVEPLGPESVERTGGLYGKY